MVQFAHDRRRRERELRAERVRPGGLALDLDGLHDVADRVLESQQQALRERAETVLDYWDARVLYIAGSEAIGALAECESLGYAKQRQLVHSDNRPLAVCIAGYVRRPFTTVIGPTEVQAIGCLRVFNDSVRLSGSSMWSRLCSPDCQPSKHRSMRRAEKALTDRAVQIAAVQARSEYVETPEGVQAREHFADILIARGGVAREP
jgi:hypothetical protein